MSLKKLTRRANGGHHSKTWLKTVQESKKGGEVAKKTDDALDKAQARITELESIVADRLSKATKFCVFSKNDMHIYVELRSNGLWAVTHLGECLTADGDWLYEPLSSNRTEDFLARTRFSFNDAWALAEKKAGEIMGVNPGATANINPDVPTSAPRT